MIELPWKGDDSILNCAVFARNSILIWKVGDMNFCKTTGLLGLLLLLQGSSIGANQPLTGPIAYQEIADWFIAGMPEEQVQRQPKTVDQTRTIPTPSMRQRLNAIGPVYGAYQPRGVLPKSYQSIRDVTRDIELFRSSNTSDGATLFTAIDRTTTALGRMELARMLTEPTADVDQIARRQAFIKQLVESPELLNQLEDLVASIDESAIFSYWTEEKEDARKGLLGWLYAPIPDNEQPRPKDMEMFVRGLQLAQGALVAQRIKTAVSLAVKLKDFLTQTDAAEMRTAFYAYVTDAGSILSPEIGLTSLMLFRATPGFVRELLKMKDDLNYLQTKLIKIAPLVRSVNTFDAYVERNNVLADALPSYPQAKALCNGSTAASADCKTLLELLQTDTFVGQASFFSWYGRILVAHRAMILCKHELAPLMHLVGELDAYIAIAKLVKEMHNKRVGYCFVEFVQNDKPYVKMDNLWNPMVDPEIVVTNSIELGGYQLNRSMVVTGSNTGGKSTLLKGIMINVWLAHTLGIAPAQAVQLTPFAYIGSSMNIVDNTALGNSLYQAEIKRVQSIFESIKSLEHNQFGFVIADELFRGTSPTQAEEATYRCTQHLVRNEQTLAIVATHYKTLATKLEEETGGICKNYKVDIVKNADGSLTRPFKLEPGIGSVDVASDLLDMILEPSVCA